MLSQSFLFINYEYIKLFTEEEESVDDTDLENGGINNPASDLMAEEMDEAEFMPSDLNKSR